MLALICGLLWVLAVGTIWMVFGRGETTGQGSLFNWFARFHILFVHLPIGMIFLVVAMEIGGFFRGLRPIRDAIPFVLWMTLLSGIASAVLGYLLMEIEDFAGRAMTLHFWTGMAMVGASLFALVCKLAGQSFCYGVSLVAAVLSVSAAGHFGGALVHDADYLAEHAPAPLKPLMLAGLSSPRQATGEEATVPTGEIALADRVVYTDFVVPILEKTCNECHNANKIKGDLRMDTYDLLMAGAEGSDYPTVIPGNAEESELIVRVVLPEDDTEFMPPKGEPLSPAEVELLKLWIAEGARPDSTVRDLGDSPEILSAIEAVMAKHRGATVAGDASAPGEDKVHVSTVELTPEGLR